jgi:chromosome segregation protein
MRFDKFTTLAQEAVSWTSRKEQSTAQDEALRARLSSEEEELAALAARPEEIAEIRNALMDQLQDAEGARREAADALQVGENALSSADRALKEAEHLLAAVREERVRREGAVQQGELTMENVDAQIREKIVCEPEDVRSHTRILLKSDDAP